MPKHVQSLLHDVVESHTDLSPALLRLNPWRLLAVSYHNPRKDSENPV